MQRIPWPQAQQEADEYGGRADFHDNWEFNEFDFPWLLDTNGKTREVLT